MAKPIFSTVSHTLIYTIYSEPYRVASIASRSHWLHFKLPDLIFCRMNLGLGCVCQVVLECI